jgi:hypothetical protein
MICATMHTKSYEEKAKRLALSALRVGVTLVDNHIEPGEKWRLTTHKKAPVILAALERFKGDILWVDADSEFRRYPIEAHRLPETVTIAAFNHAGFLWGSTIFWRNNLEARSIIERWVAQNTDTPQYSADNNLWHILEEGRLASYTPLPQAYASCSQPGMWDLPEVAEPVIVHHGSFSGPEKYSGIRHPGVTP